MSQTLTLSQLYLIFVLKLEINRIGEETFGTAPSFTRYLLTTKLNFMDDKSEAKDPLDGQLEKEIKDFQIFLLEQFNKLSLQENLGLNSRIKRTFVRP